MEIYLLSYYPHISAYPHKAETPKKMIAEESSSAEVQQILKIPTIEDLIHMWKNTLKKLAKQDEN